MKIVKEGNLERLKETRVFKCGHCHCEFEADKGEYKTKYHYNEVYYSCECPTCKQTIPDGKEKNYE